VRLIDMGALPLTLIVSLGVTVLLLAFRVLVMTRVQTHRQRENRQETERLKSLVTAYRSLAGSFSPAADADRAQVEEALADVVLFGSPRQVEMAAQCARALVTGQPADYRPLVDDLRSDLREQLGLPPIPSSIDLPAAGPGRSARRDGEGRRGGGGGGGGGMGGGTMAGGAGGVGAGIVVGDGLRQAADP